MLPKGVHNVPPSSTEWWNSTLGAKRWEAKNRKGTMPAFTRRAGSQHFCRARKGATLLRDTVGMGALKEMQVHNGAGAGSVTTHRCPVQEDARHTTVTGVTFSDDGQRGWSSHPWPY